MLTEYSDKILLMLTEYSDKTLLMSTEYSDKTDCHKRNILITLRTHFIQLIPNNFIELG